MNNQKIKMILKILLGFIIVLLFFIIIVFLIHRIKSNIEYKKLREAGYINKYSAGEYDLNIYRIGNKKSKHKLIGISGLGVNNYSIEMSFVNEKLKGDYEIIYIDRAGYGFSDDTSKIQIIEQIVSDYRNVLKNAGIEGPYILMPHSIGGVYATYWESIYPKEIEGVIFIDGTEVGINIYDEYDYNIDFSDYLDLYLCKLGMQRLKTSEITEPLPNQYNKVQQEYTDYLNINACVNKASLSEIKEKNSNANKAYENIKSNDIPKIYINATRAERTVEEFKETLEWVSKRKKELGLETITTMPSDELILQEIEKNIKWENENLLPYINLLGNTKIINLPGDHYIFEQKPDELANVIKEFIKSIN